MYSLQTSHTMAFTLYLLARHPEAQKKLQEEVDTVLHSHEGPLTVHHLAQLSYLKAVIKESLRHVCDLKFSCFSSYIQILVCYLLISFHFQNLSSCHWHQSNSRQGPDSWRLLNSQRREYIFLLSVHFNKTIIKFKSIWLLVCKIWKLFIIILKE